MLRFLAGVLAAGLVTGRIYFDSFLVGAIISLCLTFTYPMYMEAEEKKKKRLLLMQFKDLLYSMSASMVLGRNMKQSLEESLKFWKNIYDDRDPITVEVKRMLREMDETNETDTKVLRDFAVRSELPDITDFVNVYESCKVTGGDMPKAISRAAAVIGDKITMEKELELALSEKLMEGRIVGAAPFLMTLAMKLMSPGYMSPLYESTGGMFVAAASLGLSVFALILIERINRIEF